MMSTGASAEKFVPGSDSNCEDIFQYPYTVDESTISYLGDHGRIMFIIRGVAGTGKNSLAEMLSSCYPGAVMYSADDYFQNTFSSKNRDRRSLGESHEYCRKKVESACLKDEHTIVVKNTHVKKFEFQKYLDCAAKFNYTVIIASTMDKFQISPEILAASNTKGLNKEYFESRLKQWCDLFPILTGWFLSPADSSYLINDLQTSLEYLLGDGKFCRVLNCYEKKTILKHYQAKNTLYCVAACNETNNAFYLKDYYKSSDVRKHYGECFDLPIFGFLVTNSNIFAIVNLDANMKNLHLNKGFSVEKNEEDSMDSILDNLQSLHISRKSFRSNFDHYNQNSPLNGSFESHPKTASVTSWEENESVNIKGCSCIHLAETKAVEGLLPWTAKIKFHAFLAGGADSNGVISIDKFGELEDGYRYCRLPNDAWILRPPQKLSLKSVFTGMYD